MRYPQKLKEYDDNLRKGRNILHIAGFDEAGRGPLCGPVTCGGVILPSDFSSPYVDDSKKLTAKERERAEALIKGKAIAWAVAFISPADIDRINILEASRLGMEQCLEKLLKKAKIELCVTDYMDLHTSIPLIKLAHGDATSQAVAAASILAKTARDRYMDLMDKHYPGYGFSKHKGYPTKAHIQALEAYGVIKGFYRESYNPVKKALESKGYNLTAGVWTMQTEIE